MIRCRYCGELLDPDDNGTVKLVICDECWSKYESNEREDFDPQP